eukprot:7945656-Karenia_brevis.AAC.1
MEGLYKHLVLRVATTFDKVLVSVNNPTICGDIYCHKGLPEKLVPEDIVPASVFVGTGVFHSCPCVG